jgi:SSS family solute:Na+ symporter
MVYGTIQAYQVINPATGKHFGGSLGEIPGLGEMGYIALTSFVLNVVIAAALSVVLNALKVPNGRDSTVKSDYYADAGDPRVSEDLAAHRRHDQPYGDPDDIPGNFPI